MAKAMEAAAPRVVWNKREGKFETEYKEAFLQYYLRDVKAVVEGVVEGEEKMRTYYLRDVKAVVEGVVEGEEKMRTKTVMDMVHISCRGARGGMGLVNQLCVGRLITRSTIPCSSCRPAPTFSWAFHRTVCGRVAVLNNHPTVLCNNCCRTLFLL